MSAMLPTATKPRPRCTRRCTELLVAAARKPPPALLCCIDLPVTLSLSSCPAPLLPRGPGLTGVLLLHAGACEPSCVGPPVIRVPGALRGLAGTAGALSLLLGAAVLSCGVMSSVASKPAGPHTSTCPVSVPTATMPPTRCTMQVMLPALCGSCRMHEGPQSRAYYCRSSKPVSSWPMMGIGSATAKLHSWLSCHHLKPALELVHAGIACCKSKAGLTSELM